MLRRTFSFVPITLPLALALFTLFALWTAAPAQANGIVTNCSNDTDFTNQLAVGGTITFNCGTATIPLSGTKTISVGTVINGGGTITLAGTHAFRLFIVNSGASLDLQHITLSAGYSTSGDGGGVLNNGFFALDFSTIENTGASGNNGGAVATTGTSDITGSTFSNNQAGLGGAIYASGSGAHVSISSSTFSHNSVASNVAGSNRGGAIYATNNANVQIGASTFDSNSGGDGGAIYNDATLSLVSSTLSNNKSTVGDGGGFENTGSATLTNDTIVNNQAHVFGGGVGNAGTAVLSGMHITGNTAFVGGGIYNVHSLTVSSSTFTQNHETGGGNGGGGLAQYGGSLILSTSTFSGNTAAGGGAAIETAFSGTTATISNVTLSGNIGGNEGGEGGGLHVFKSTARLTNVTITGNAATTGGGIGIDADPAAHLYLTNVLVANNTTGGNCTFGQAPDLSIDNLSSDNTCNFNINNANALLGPLETNGGSTLTERLLAGSPAIDGGANSGCPPTDQRGIARIQGSDCDIGAVEFVPCSDKPTAASILSPAPNSQMKAGSVLFDWAGPDCATKFKIIIRQGKTTNPNFLAKKVFPASQFSTSLPKKKYFWQLKACNSAGCTATPFSEFKLTN